MCHQSGVTLVGRAVPARRPLYTLNTIFEISAGVGSCLPRFLIKHRVSAALRLCVESSSPTPREETRDPAGARVETQNPAKTLPFPCQDSEVHKDNLSAVADEGRAATPSGADAVPLTLNHYLDPVLSPSPLSLELPTAEGPGADSPALEGESIPVSPYESTRDWLERQGINISKIPKGARVITAG